MSDEYLYNKSIAEAIAILRERHYLHCPSGTQWGKHKFGDKCPLVQLWEKHKVPFEYSPRERRDYCSLCVDPVWNPGYHYDPKSGKPEKVHD